MGIHKTDCGLAVLGKPYYVACVDDVGGTVVETGLCRVRDEEMGIYEFYYRTYSLPDTTTKVCSFANLLKDYTIEKFITATGTLSDGTFISSGRTDNDNRIIVQQFSRNNKTMTIRTYKAFPNDSATFKITFVGKKNS